MSEAREEATKDLLGQIDPRLKASEAEVARLREQLDAARQALTLIESQAEAFLTDGLMPKMTMIRVRDRAHAARAALGEGS